MKGIIYFLFWILIVLGLIYFFVDREWVDIYPPRKDSILTDFHSLMIVVLTIILIYIAYINLTAIKSINQADFLQQIITRYTSEEIIKARIIIHELYILTDRAESETTKRARIRLEINNMSNNSERASDYVHLLNLLDYLEFISYFANSGKISENELHRLLENSLDFYYDIYRDWIDARRLKYSIGSYYCEFTALIDRKKQSKKCSVKNLVYKLFCCNFK